MSEGKIKPAGMITKKIRLNEVEDEGFSTLINDKDNHVKILVDVAAGLS
jgi:threonine dehydrogenase-like Zn-dependent dehydrogenase